MDLEYSPGVSTTALSASRMSPEPQPYDLSYDHLTGELKPMTGVTVSRYENPDQGWFGGHDPEKRSDYPGEEYCKNERIQKKEDIRFKTDDLKAKLSIFCIKTAQDHNGFLIVKPIPDQKPDAYDVYSYVWVR
ncbi:MAG: hypothetical protein DLM60_04590 [Pseudonocardiales bacterium]|nr:MAG: hypothetical protein DLM60_04590 [Pseudonocardiales bacterium]